MIEEIDVAVFAFDGDQRLRLVNRGGERLLGQPSERLIGRPSDALGLSDWLDGDSPAHLRGDVSRRRGPMGSAERDLPAGRPAPPAARDRRPEPRAPRGRALGVAAAGAGAGPRDQQLARADQVDRGEPPQPDRAAARGRPTGRTTSARASRSSKAAPRRSDGSWAPTRGWRGSRSPSSARWTWRPGSGRVAALETRLEVR